MTASRPAGALRQSVRVIAIADENSTGLRLLLEMAFEAQRRVARDQHALIDRAVRRVAGNAALANGVVFEDERSSLRGVTLQASLVSR